MKDLLLLLLLCTAVVIISRYLLKRSLRFSGIDGLAISSALFICGIASVSFHFEKEKNTIAGEKNIQRIIVCVNSEPVVKENKIKFEGRIISWQQNGQWKNGDERSLFYLDRSAASENLRYGEEIVIARAPIKTKGIANPGEFDYAAWLSKREIFSNVFAHDGQWRDLGLNNGNYFVRAAFSLRKYCLGKFVEYGMNGNEFGVAAALLLGDSDHLDPSVIRSYSASGVLHVLSVSGMHVALIYVILLKLLGPFEKRKYSKWFSFFLQLFFLWFYATLTGLCPSVLRSVTMLTVVIIGKAMGRNGNIVNSIAASAFILLLFDPLLLFDAGFQLSYFAVAGIVIVQPLLAAKWEPDFFLWRHLWTMFTVTIVAQLFTFPLGLYYFKQFPSYFLFANMIIIPLSTIVLYAGLVFLVCSPVRFITKLFAVVFIFLVHLLNSCVAFTEHLPYSSVHFSPVSVTSTILLYAVIISGMIFMIKRHGNYFNVFLASGVLLFISLNSFTKMNSGKIIFFSVNRETAIGFVNQNSAGVFVDSALAVKKENIDFHVSPFFSVEGKDNEEIIPVGNNSSGVECIDVGNRKIIIAQQNDFSSMKSEPDFLLLKNFNKKFPEIPPSWKHVVIITDASDSEFEKNKIRTYCSKRNLKTYDLESKGALIINSGSFIFS